MQGSNPTESICEYTDQCLKVESFTYTNSWIRIVNNTTPDELERPPIHIVASSKYVVTMNPIKQVPIDS